MIDPYTKEELYKSIVPSSIKSKQQIINIISSAYINNSTNSIFDIGFAENALYTQKSQLTKLSLSASILNSKSENAFLIAESDEILFKEINNKIDSNLHSLLTLSDIAFYYHLSSFDANAAIIAENIIQLLQSNSSIPQYVFNYYKNYSDFLKGNFNLFPASIEYKSSSSTITIIYSFLNDCLIQLMHFYGNAVPIQDFYKEKISELVNLFQTDCFEWQLGIEIKHVNGFFKTAEEKALLPKLINLDSLNKEYIQKIKYKFVTPPINDFINQYFAEDHSNVIINTPTGSGKSFLVELAISKNLDNGWVLYLAPTNALCHQISHDLKINLHTLLKNSIDVIYGFEEYSKVSFNDKKIVVTTPEKALILMKIFPDDFKLLNMLVLDECHILGDANRGILAESVIGTALDLNPLLKTVLLSAMVENPSSLKSWLDDISNGNTIIIDNKWKPTRNARFLVTLDSNETTLDKKIEIHADIESPWNKETKNLISITLPIDEIKAGKLPSEHMISRILTQRLDSVGKRTLLFVVPSKHIVFTIGSNWKNRTDKTLLNNYERALFNISEYELGTKSLVKEIVEKKGVTTHSAAMLHCEQDASIHIFNRKESGVNTLISTGTLTQGMNLSIDTVVIDGTIRRSGYKKNLKIDEILNAMGRVARANYSIHGSTFIIPNPKNMGKPNSKNEMIDKSVCIDKVDASTRIESSLSLLINQIQSKGDINQAEKELMSILPSDMDKARVVLSKTLGAYNTEKIIIDKIINRFISLQEDYIDTYNVDYWVLESASIACLPPLIAIYFYIYIKHGFIDKPSIDNYQNWVNILLSLINRFGDKTVINDLESKSNFYSCIENHSHLQTRLNKWISGDSYCEIGKNCDDNKQKDLFKRSSATHHPLPKVFNWIRDVPVKISRYAGLLFALQEKWIENESLSIPDWFRDSNKLSTLSLGIKYGVNSPESLACYENIIHERMVSNHLAEINGQEIEDPGDKNIRYGFAKDIRNRIILNTFISSDNIVDNVNTILSKTDKSKSEIPF